MVWLISCELLMEWCRSTLSAACPCCYFCTSLVKLGRCCENIVWCRVCSLDDLCCVDLRGWERERSRC